MAKTEDVHQFHGTYCICGFDSHGRSRSMTEHILTIERERIAAICMMLLDSGDITPMGVRMITKEFKK